MSILSNNANMVRYVLFIFNVVFLITGIILLGIGIGVTSVYAQYDDFLESNFFSIPTFLIVIGIFIILITFFGCWGSMRESYRLTLIFAILLAFIFILELIAGICGYALRADAQNLIEKSLQGNLANYKVDTSTTITVLWDNVQRGFECCGVKNYTDWSVNNYGDNLPLSCCEIPNGIVGSFSCTSLNDNAYRHGEGCLTLFSSYIAGHAVSLGAAGIIIAIIQFIGVVFASYVARELKIRNGIVGWF